MTVNPPHLRCLRGLLLICAVLSCAAQPNETATRKLSFAEPANGSLRRMNQASYELKLQQGQFLKVTVVNLQFIPILTLQDRAGKTVLEVQFANIPAPAKLFYRVQQSDTYYLKIAPEEDLGEQLFFYEIQASVTASPTEQEQAYAHSLTLIEKYWPLLSRGTPESLTELLAITQENLKLCRALGERPNESVTLTFMAEAYKTREQYEPALEKFHEALAILREMGNSSRIAGGLIPIGQIHAARSDYKVALPYYLEALPLFDPQKYANRIGWCLTNIGHVYSDYGELTKALEYYQRAYDFYSTYAGLVNEKHLGLGVTLGSQGNVYFALGEKQKAIESLQQALTHLTRLPNKLNEFLTYARLGEMYTAMGDYQKAEVNLSKAQRYFRNSQTTAEARTLSSLGQYDKAKGNYPQALNELQAALVLYRTLGNRRATAQTLTQIGAVYSLLGQWENALNHYSEAQVLWQDIGDKYSEGSTLNYLGMAHADRNEKTQARTYFRRALELRQFTRDREGEANTRYHLARLAASEGDLTAAQKEIEHTLALTESVRATVSNDELRASYLATVKDYYEFYVDLLMRLEQREPGQSFSQRALQASEMARARTLNETLTNTHRTLRQNLTPELRQRETALQQRLNAKADYQRKLSSSQATAELLTAAEQEIQSIVAELQETRTAINRLNPRYADLLQTRPLSVQEIQQSLLDDETLLLVYALGSERSHLWVVFPQELKSFVLPGRAAIETTARKVYELLLPQKELCSMPVFQRAIGELRELILPAELLSLLGEKRLLIVADGALQFIPFSVFPDAENTPLIVKHEIVNLPSATSLALLRRETQRRRQAPKTIAIFADPVFTNDDARLPGLRTKANRATMPASLEQALRDIGETPAKLQRLPFTRREATTIMALVAPQERKIALDFVATRANARDASLRNYRIIHFATHGILNSVNPELSGVILSLVDQEGKALDGFFRLHEIYNLQLNAELVVLSACQTGLGKEVRGEGLIGLTRGFMFAGTPRVIASLWKVNDRATSELMKNFYQAMLGPSKKSAAAALRQAQMSMLQQTRWAHPSFWAGFNLQGDWK